MIGPSLPSHLKRRRGSTSEEDQNKPNESNLQNKDTNNIGPQLSPYLNKQEKQEIKQAYNEALENERIGSSKTKDNKVAKVSKPRVGPQLPPHLMRQKENEEEEDNEESEESEEHKSEDEIIGPMPSTTEASEETSLRSKLQDIERRAQPHTKQVSAKREEWMTVPPESKLIGDPLKLLNRTFNQRQIDSKDLDNSLWTETPQEREERIKYGVVKKKEDKNISPYVLEEQKNKKSKKESRKEMSLMEMHKMKNKINEKDDDPKNRRFNWEKDMKVDKLDPKKQKDIVEGSKSLNSRFSSGRS